MNSLSNTSNTSNTSNLSAICMPIDAMKFVCSDSAWIGTPEVTAKLLACGLAVPVPNSGGGDSADFIYHPFSIQLYWREMIRTQFKGSDTNYYDLLNLWLTKPEEFDRLVGIWELLDD